VGEIFLKQKIPTDTVELVDLQQLGSTRG
jgi:hypothetical protein